MISSFFAKERVPKFLIESVIKKYANFNDFKKSKSKYYLLKWNFTFS